MTHRNTKFPTCAGATIVLFDLTVTEEMVTRAPVVAAMPGTSTWENEDV